MIKLNKEEKTLIKIMNELDLDGIDGGIKKVLENYFINRGWMNKDGSFRLNDGGYACLAYMARKDML